jgi:hypothetical protein
MRLALGEKIIGYFDLIGIGPLRMDGNQGLQHVVLVEGLACLHQSSIIDDSIIYM